MENNTLLPNIESGIPVPALVVGRDPSKWRSLLPKLKPGDSFLLTGDDKKSVTTVTSIARKMGIPVTVRTVPEGVRVWRKP